MQIKHFHFVFFSLMHCAAFICISILSIFSTTMQTTHLSGYKDMVPFCIPLSLPVEVTQLSIPVHDWVSVKSTMCPLPPQTQDSFAWHSAPLYITSLMYPLCIVSLLDSIEAFALTTWSESLRRKPILLWNTPFRIKTTITDFIVHFIYCNANNG